MYTIEKVEREYKDGKKEIKFIAGVGNLTNDIEVKSVKLKDGTSSYVVGGYGQNIAFNYYEDGEKKALFYPIEAWGKTAEALGKIGKKGMEIAVIGRLEERSYTSKNTQKTYINEVLVIEKFQVTSRGWRDEGLRENSSPKNPENENFTPDKDFVPDGDFTPVDDEIPF
jgi:single-strand DNA-binding protein